MTYRYPVMDQLPVRSFLNDPGRYRAQSGDELAAENHKRYSVLYCAVGETTGAFQRTVQLDFCRDEYEPACLALGYKPERWVMWRNDVSWPGRNGVTPWHNSAGETLLDHPEWMLRVPALGWYQQMSAWFKAGWKIEIHPDWDDFHKLINDSSGFMPVTYGHRDDAKKTLYVTQPIWDLRIPEYQAFAIEHGTWLYRGGDLAMGPLQGLIVGHKPSYYMDPKDMSPAGTENRYLSQSGTESGPLVSAAYKTPTDGGDTQGWVSGMQAVTNGLFDNGVQLAAMIQTDGTTDPIERDSLGKKTGKASAGPWYFMHGNVRSRFQFHGQVAQ